MEIQLILGIVLLAVIAYFLFSKKKDSSEAGVVTEQAPTPVETPVVEVAPVVETTLVVEEPAKKARKPAAKKTADKKPAVKKTAAKKTTKSKKA